MSKDIDEIGKLIHLKGKRNKNKFDQMIMIKFRCLHFAPHWDGVMK